MPKNYFHVTRNENGTYGLKSRKDSVYFYDNNCTEEEIKRYRELHLKSSNKPIAVVEHIPNIKRPERAVDMVEYFFGLLEGKDYYRIADLSITLHSEDGARYWIPNDSKGKEYISHLEPVRFSIVSKAVDLSSNENVMHFENIKLKGGYYLLGIMGNLKFHNRRVGFYIPPIGKQVSITEARQILGKKIERFHYAETIVRVSDISKKTAKKKFVGAIDKKKNERIVMQREFREIMKLDAEQLDSYNDVERLKMRIRNSKWYRTQIKLNSIQGKEGYKIDKSFRNEKNKKELENLNVKSKI